MSYQAKLNENLLIEKYTISIPVALIIITLQEHTFFLIKHAYTPPPWYLQFQAWDKVRCRSSYTPLEMMIICDTIVWITWFMF